MEKELIAAGCAARRNSNTQILEELEALSESLYESHKSSRRTASLALPRTTTLPSADDEAKFGEKPISTKPRSRRMSLSPWRSSRPNTSKPDNENVQATRTSSNQPNPLEAKTEKKGLWNWKPIRALSHIGMQKLSCLLSVEVVTAQGLPASMNGLRLSVCIRKKETKDGAVNTMPSRVQQGAADFEETLFIRCSVYCSSKQQQPRLKFEPRPFLIYLFAVDAPDELDFGRNTVDLSQLIQESVEKNYEGTRVRQWDFSFNLLGKAKGGELIVKLGFQIMEKDGGIGIYSYNQAKKSKNFSSSSLARKQSKASFSVLSPKIQGRSFTPQKGVRAADLQELDDLNLDEPAPAPASIHNSGEQEKNEEFVEFPEFEVVDKGIEIHVKEDVGEEIHDSEEETDEDRKSSSSKEVVKEIVHDQLHMKRLTELDSIAQQIKALESMMGDDQKIVKPEDDDDDNETESQRLDAEEETVTREFLQLLEGQDYKLNQPLQLVDDKAEDSNETDAKVYLQDLGKGLGCVVQTRDGGYLAATNPFDTLVSRTDAPKLAMQMSKPMVVPSDKTLSGFELFQKMAAIGLEKLSPQILSLMPPQDEIAGKTAEQIAFEGIASSIIQGRNKEGASSSAARTIAAVKSMANAMRIGRKERIGTGIWNVNETPLTAEEILAFSLQKIEGMAVEALKVQADMAEEEAPFDVSALVGKKNQEKQQQQPLDSAIPLDDWIKNYSLNSSEAHLLGDQDQEQITIALVVQLRDPLRRYEAVGGPILALIHASSSGSNAINKYDDDEEEKRFKVTSLHVGGLKVPTAGKRNIWDSEKHRLTAMQWLVAYGLGKSSGRKGKRAVSKGSQDLLWSISSRVMADMWLKTMRNPDVKFAK